MTKISSILRMLVGAQLASACGESFEPRTTLERYRVMGIQTTPPEVGPDDRVEVTVHDYQPDAGEVDYRWTLCLYSLGAEVDYACFDPALEREVGDTSRVELDLGPDGLNLRALLPQLDATVYADGSPRNLTRGFDLFLRLDSGPRGVVDERIQTVKRIRVREGGGEAPNENPVIEAFEVEGEALAGGKVRLRLETDTEQMYIDPQTGAASLEEYLYTWYTDSGETSPGLTFGAERETELELPSEPGQVQLAVAVRDGRGGLAVARRSLRVE